MMCGKQLTNSGTLHDKQQFDACHEKIDLFEVKKWAIFRSSILCKIGSIRATTVNLVSK